MNRINPKEAPEGYVARKPKQFNKEYNTSLCIGCGLYQETTCLNTNPKAPFCTRGTRDDKRDVIFVKKT